MAAIEITNFLSLPISLLALFLSLLSFFCTLFVLVKFLAQGASTHTIYPVPAQAAKDAAKKINEALGARAQPFPKDMNFDEVV